MEPTQPMLPRAPSDDVEREAFEFRDIRNIQRWCGKQNMADARILLCTRLYRDHAGDHVACSQDFVDGRPGVILSRWSEETEPLSLLERKCHAALQALFELECAISPIDTCPHRK